MKNQYFGDINDYLKYGLLRAVIETTDCRLLVAWMLTPDDGGTDGKFTDYIERPKRWANFDPELFFKLSAMLLSNDSRGVFLLEEGNVLVNARYFSELTPDAGSSRDQWFHRLSRKSANHDVIFLDPDNGLEVRSVPYGRGRSSKYLYWHEVESLWSAGKSLVIYQHYAREKRVEFIRRISARLGESTPGSRIGAFATPRVAFLVSLQAEHSQIWGELTSLVGSRWNGQITSIDFS